MPFDFNADFLNNPALQYGLNLLGSRGTANPYATAQQAMQQMQQAQTLQQYQQQQMEQIKQKTLMEQQQLEMAKQQQDRQNAFYETVKPFLGNIFGSQPTQQPGGPPVRAPQQMPATGAVIPPEDLPGSQLTTTEVGKFGTPKAILRNLKQVESSGNPLAINPQSKAMGAYQFLPDTVAMLKQQGVTFDPFKPDQAENAADYYLQQLVAKHGGDYNAALAEYGGFKTKDPSGYIAKVMKGIAPSVTPPQPAQTAPQMQLAQNETNPALPSMQAGQLGLAAGLAGVKGAQQLMDYAKLMQEKNAPGGSWRIGPNGEKTWLPDMYKEQELARKTPVNGATIPGMSPEDVSAMTRVGYENQARFLQDHFSKVENIPQQLLAVREARAAAANAIPFTGSQAEKKLAAAKFLNNNFGWAGVKIQPDAVANAELMRSALFTPIFSSLKQLDAQPSVSQQEAMQEAFGQITTDPKALPKILDMVEERLRFGLEKHNKMVSQAEAKGVPLATDLHLQLPAEQKTPPRIGEVRSKYVYMGGDPADKNNWKPRP